MHGGTVFHLIRHGAHDLLGRVLTGRMPGIGISEAGRRQAERVAEALAAHPVAAVISSPQARAVQTAEPIAARLGLRLRHEPGFDEIDFGAWTGLAFEALHRLPEWHAFNRFRSAAPVPGGESVLAAQARAVAAVARLQAEFPDAGLVVVSHGDIIKSVLAHFLGVPLDLFGRIEISPGSRSVLVLFAEDARIEAINLPAV